MIIRRMKWLILLLVFLQSCEKEYCWDCTLYTTSRTGINTYTDSASKKEYCNTTEDEINKIIADNLHRGNNYRSTMECSKR